MDTFFQVAVIALNLAWLIPLILYFRRANKARDERRRILETGVPAEAEILKVDEVGPYYSRVPHLLFALRVHVDPRTVFETTAKGFFRQLDYPRLQPGMRVEVRFDPATRAVAVVGDKLT